MNYSNYKDFQKTQCTKLTPLMLISLTFFFQIQRNFQWLLNMHWATAFYAKGPMDVHLSQNAKCYFFEISPKIWSLFSPHFKRSETCYVFEEHIFTLSIFFRNQFFIDMLSSGPNNHQLKIMHFSAKNNILYKIFQPTSIHGSV